MRMIFSSFILSVFLAVSCSAAYAQKSTNILPPPTVRPAIDGILAAFQKHPLVAVGNNEDNAQEEDFYAALVSDPRFAREVGNVVVEFGSSAHQDTIDRYLNGQDVSYSDLRKVWSDIVGFNFPTAIGYVNFFVQVRDVNRTLPPKERIRVWLGEPPIDWSKVRIKADFFHFMAQRDSYPAGVIEKEILAKNKKALALYGSGHFYDDWSFLKLVEKKYPGTFFKVQMYSGYVSKSCAATFEKDIQSWPTPALVTPVQGTSLEGKLYRPNCDVLPRTSWTFHGSMTKAQISQAIDHSERRASGVDGDALLFLGKSASLTQSPFEPSIYLDPDYRREMDRRTKIGLMFERGGDPQTDATAKSNPVSPQYIHRQ